MKISVDITWVDAPVNQYPIVGQDYRIRCEVQANPAPIVTWSRNGKNIATDNRYIIENKGLLIKNVKESDDGVYACRAVVVHTGSFKVRDIKVEVQVPPQIQPMSEVKVIEGESASIVCNATGKPPPTYTWIKEMTRENLATTDRFDVNKNTGMLIINRVESNDDSHYKCVAENTAGRVETSVKISVLVKPKIYSFINVTAPVKKQTSITCKAHGRPPPEITFRKLSRQEPYRVGSQLTDRRITLEERRDKEKGESFGTLFIENLNRTDDGLYECIAKNDIGVAFANGHITVEFPPSFDLIKDYPPVYTWADRPANLTCIAEAIPNATIKWRLANIEIAEGPNMKIYGHGPVSSLIVTPYNEKRFFTKYECIALNPLGENRHFIELRQAEVPRPVQQVKVESITATTVKFNIVPPNNLRGLPLRSITVQYRREGDFSWDFARNYTWSVG